MNASTVREKHKQYLFPNVANYYAETVVLERAKGMHVFDKDGRQYLDFFGGILTVSVGHCHDKVVERTHAQMKKLGHTSSLYPTENLVALAERLAAAAPRHEKGWKAFFTSSGTEADETAVLLARVHTGASEVIALRHSYSGRSALAINLMGHANWRVTASQIPGIKHAHAPYCYRCDLGLEYPSCGLKCAKDIETLIQTETCGKPSAFLAETLLGVGGFITPPPEYFKEAVGIVRKYGGLFICDEVQTGFGRTGKHLFGIEHYGVVPDIITLAKGIANGAPVGATLAKAEIADSFKAPSIATYGGNSVSMAAALATLDVIDEEKLVERSAVMGAHLREGLESLRRDFPIIGDVRGMGLMQAMELVKDRRTKEPDPQAANRFMEETKKRGLLIGKGGLYGNVLRVAPPMIASRGDIDDALGVFREAYTAMA
jgi:4-aminobutyrate aminotransferase-like enzyme